MKFQTKNEHTIRTIESLISYGDDKSRAIFEETLNELKNMGISGRKKKIALSNKMKSETTGITKKRLK